MPYPAVIFDMDGVLIDSEPLWKIAMEEVFHSVGCSLTRADFQKTVGLRIDEVVHYWYKVAQWRGPGPSEVEGMIVERMDQLIRQEGEALPGVVETIAYLQTCGVKVGLATSSYTSLIRAVLETIGLNGHFHTTRSAEHEAFGKPHPAVYLSVAEQLSVAPHECLVVEDSLNGIISGKAARMKVACIPEKTHYPEPRLALADYMYESMHDLLNDLKNTYTP
jgi:sugar-phosphatase